MPARVSARALKNFAVWAGAIGTGSAVGAALAIAYLAGGMAQSAAQHARVTRLAAAAEQGFSEDALLDSALSMDPGALAVARRHDPFTTAGAAHRDRQAALIAARLERSGRERTARDLLLRASFSGPFNPAAQPFRLGGALDASRDLECLTQAVYYEARGEGPAGQAAVAQVVLNRVRHPAFPKSVCAVVFQGAYGKRSGCQFSFACDGSMRARREPAAWRRAQRVAERALNGGVMSAVGNATHFHTVAVAPPWGPRLLRVAQVGLHVFYRFGGRSGRPGAFSVTPELSVDTPEMAVEPIYASYTTPVPTLAEPAAPEQVFRLAGAVLETKPEIAPSMAAASGMGGPLGQPQEPASAPIATAPAEAKPAPVEARASTVTKLQADPAVKPAKPTSSSAS